MSDLGDLSDFMKEGSISDLDWLDVDEKSYREQSPEPQYNLDISPDLEEAWSHGDRSASGFVPNTGSAPTSSVSSGDSRLASDVIAHVVRVARTLLMQDPNPQKLVGALKVKFGMETLRAAKTALADVLRERGLLGRYYIAAEDFPGCSKLNKTSIAFARRFASTAKYVKACGSCSGCSHNKANTCGVFQKQIVMDVPYTDELAAQVERMQTAKGKVVQASEKPAKERIRLALLADDVVVASVQAPKPVVNPAQFLRASEAPKKVHLPVLNAERQRIANAELAWSHSASEGRTASEKTAKDKVAFEVVQLLKKEMLKGRGERDLLQVLKLSFSVEDLKATRDRWEPLFKEAGLYGSVYSTQDSFDDCHEGADFLARQASSVKGIVAGEKCKGCIHNKMARCLLYGRPLVAKAEDLYTAQTLDQTVREYRLAGRVGSEPVVAGGSVRDTLKQVYRTASEKVDSSPLRSYVTAFTGGSLARTTSGLTKREVVKTAKRYLNEGLYGQDLLAALKGRFDPRDIKASQDDLKAVLAEQGLQGVFYVDAAVYEDYGKGCDEGSRLHRARLVPYVKMGSKCTTCVHQARAGHCSKYAKPLVVEPPYQDKAAQQREILASGNSTEFPLTSLLNGNRNILAQFEMQAEMQVELDEKAASIDVDVELGNAKVKL